MLDGIRERLRKRRQGIGYFSLSLYAAIWLLRKVSAGTVEIHFRYLLIQDVPGEAILKGGLRGKVDVCALEGAELRQEHDRDVNGAFSRPPRDRTRFLRRVERGDVCIAANRAARAEGVLWLTFGTFDESDVKAEFVVSAEHGMAWDSNLYILENARGGLLFAALWDGANAVLRERGYRWVATQTSAFNGPSLQAHERMGARRIGRMIYACVGPFQVTISSLRPHLALLGPADKAPVYVIPVPSDATPGASR